MSQKIENSTVFPKICNRTEDGFDSVRILHLVLLERPGGEPNDRRMKRDERIPKGFQKASKRILFCLWKKNKFPVRAIEGEPSIDNIGMKVLEELGRWRMTQWKIARGGDKRHKICSSSVGAKDRWEGSRGCKLSKAVRHFVCFPRPSGSLGRSSCHPSCFLGVFCSARSPRTSREYSGFKVGVEFVIATAKPLEAPPSVGECRGSIANNDASPRIWSKIN